SALPARQRALPHRGTRGDRQRGVPRGRGRPDLIRSLRSEISGQSSRSSGLPDTVGISPLPSALSFSSSEASAMSHLRFCSVFACLFLVILTGCSSLNTAAVRVPDSAKPTSDTEAGFVFLSVGAARTANFTHQALVFEAKGQTETSWFRFAGWSPDFEDQ